VECFVHHNGEIFPDITIGVPCRNPGTDFRRLLDAVFAQETRKRVEVTVLDSGSTDGTLALLEDYPLLRVVHVEQESFDWGRLRERLFEEARGEVVVNLSSDAIPADSQWLEHLVRPLEDESVGVSSGSSRPDPERGFAQFQWEKNGYYYFTREMKKFTARYGKGLSFANTAVRRSVWESLRVDPQATGEDFGFQTKLHAAGVKIVFPENAPVLHHHNYSLGGCYRRCRNEGLALREMGCTYNEWDLLCDLLSSKKYVQWLRELKRGSLHNGAEWLYPLLRPVAVYMGSRFARQMVWY
jgi:rhamnosyltransferase